MENNVAFQVGINYHLLNQLRKDKELTFADMEGLTTISESTIKNILLGRTRNPGMESLLPICKTLGIPVEIAYETGDIDEIKKKIEKQGIKEENIPVIALKEIYDHQIAAINNNNEIHINNIRSHYEQHHEDLRENFEKRLSDKRELIESYKEHLDSYKSHIKSLEKDLLISKIAFWVCCSVLVILLILEVANPNLGWIRF